MWQIHLQINSGKSNNLEIIPISFKHSSNHMHTAQLHTYRAYMCYCVCELQPVYYLKPKLYLKTVHCKKHNYPAPECRKTWVVGHTAS